MALGDAGIELLARLDDALPAKRPSQRWPKRSTAGAMRSISRELVGGMKRARLWRIGANMLARRRPASWPAE